jgi:hypothetical protein
MVKELLIFCVGAYCSRLYNKAVYTSQKIINHYNNIEINSTNELNLNVIHTELQLLRRENIELRR